MPEIRKATEEDLPDLIVIGWEFSKYSGAGSFGLGFDLPLFSDFMKILISRQDCIVLVAIGEDSKVLGTIGGILEPWLANPGQRVAAELWWWVDKDVRGSGISQNLISEFEAWAKEKEAAALRMHSLANKRQADLDRFYLKHGFSPVDHVFMKGL